MFRQARWDEPLIYELSKEGLVGHLVPVPPKEVVESVGAKPEEMVPATMLRKEPPLLPEVSEIDVVRHYTRLSQMNYGVDLGTYPLGSCTMKYNPKICEELASDDNIAWLHPLQDEDTVQGILEILYKLERWLCKITGMYRATLQPAAGAHGELTGCLIIRAYHEYKGEKRDEMLVPDSAHGTNPASAAMAGFKIIRIPTRDDGCVDIEALKAVVSEKTAGIMLTNPNTLGLFEKDILEIAKIVHEAGGLLYYDGANLNAILGKARPGDMGFDIVHINVHKTFGTPHGGGGPGAGPVCVTKELEKFLPIPVIERDPDKKRYYLDYNRPYSIGRVRAFYGNIIPLLKTFIYIMSLGEKGLEKVSEVAVLNTNYFLSKVKKIKGYSLPYGPERYRKHECVISAKELRKDTGVTAEDVAKAILDEGMHAPTIYFPPIVEEALMIEFTESERVDNIDRYAEILCKISEKAYKEPSELKKAPINTAVSRLDYVKANLPKTVILTYRMYIRKFEKSKSQSG